jgi:uncharacterized SAM-binding protein YcdF (DUF218 family)
MTVDKAFDAVIVLGAAVREGGKPSPTLVRRTRCGAALVLAGAARVLVVTGGVGDHPPAEAVVMRDIALEEGVSGDAIVVEDTAADTLASGRACSALMRSRGWSRALIVTDDFHLARAVMIFRWFDVEAVGHAAPGAREGLGWRSWIYYWLRDLAAWPWTVLRLVAGGRGG